MDGPEIHAPHAAHTGHRWVDLVLGCSALLVSAVSLYIAVEHGHTMEKLVAANSWPNVQFDSGLDRGAAPAPEGQARLSFALTNSGVGPARIESVEIWSAGTPLRNVEGFAAAIKANAGGATLVGGLDANTLTGQVIGARDTKTLMGMTLADGKTWLAPMAKTAAGIEARVCYCSVFDECYVVDTRRDRGRPARADKCPAPAVPFNADSTQLLLERLKKPA